MNQRFSVVNFGIKMGIGLTIGSFIGLGMVVTAGYLVMKLSPDKKEEKEEAKDGANESK